MIDFSNCKEIGCTYGGSEKKKRIIYNGDIYLLKFPDPVREKGNSLSYVNNQFSEYIGCKIIKSLGIDTQEVLLGTYVENNKIKIVTACKDFTDENNQLIEFSKLAHSVTKTDSNYSCCIEDVYSVIENSNIINKQDIIEKFWNLFVADTLIGNIDRHLDNWGLLYNIKKDKYIFAPVYDCGSALNPLISEDKKISILNNKADLKSYSYNIASAYFMKGKRISYHEIMEDPCDDLKKAIINIYPKINMDIINKIIDDTPFISEIDKTFYKESIKIRKELIIEKAYKKLENKA